MSAATLSDPHPQTAERPTSRRALIGLNALNFFLADVRDGLGPYLAIYLIAVRGPTRAGTRRPSGLS